MRTNPHGGDTYSVAERLGIPNVPEIKCDFSVNINPLGPPPQLREVLLRGNVLSVSYPDAYAECAEAHLADAHCVPRESVIAGNGSTELFGWILQALSPSSASLLAPCYAGYAEACDACGTRCDSKALLTPDNGFRVNADILDRMRGEIIFLGQPNNPTGRLADPDTILSAARTNPRRTYIVDEAFIDFCPKRCELTLIRPDTPGNIIVVKSLTKFFAVPGLRLGMAFARPDVIERLNSVRMPWTVNALSQSLAMSLYDDGDYISRTQDLTVRLREQMSHSLTKIPGFEVLASDANFVMVKLPPACPAPRLQELLLRKGILIRDCSNYEGMDSSYCRLAVRPEREIGELLTALSDIFEPRSLTPPDLKTKTPAVMVVGTTSNAGKSVLAAALCRYFARQGLSVAPFKAQNMALNSFVTREGGEMGRAQVAQAAAAGIEPHTDMNPVLLKPLGEDGSQVIVNGKAIGNYRAREYYAMKSRMRDEAHAAYDRLSAKYDLIILEGAGSPAEINLMDEDFVNMDMAHYANAATILVADIDRGGVFASILGTISLIPDRYRHLIKGVIINKFRGDPALLDSGIRDIEAMTGVPVLGILPYIKDLRVDEEDSLGLEKEASEEATVLDIAVIRLPRISNFTDFAAMACDRGIGVRYVDKADQLGTPHLIILPGSKNTRSDLDWLHSSGLSAAVKDACERRSTPVIGICGGYQMLGMNVSDPLGMEGKPGDTPGLGLLPVNTTLQAEKELWQAEGLIQPTAPFIETPAPFSGYEIHCGETTVKDSTPRPIVITSQCGLQTERSCGAVSDDGSVFGCYIHGLFDSIVIREQLYRWLCKHHSLDDSAVSVSSSNPASEYNRLADLLESSLDLSELRRLGNRSQGHA